MIKISIDEMIRAMVIAELQNAEKKFNPINSSHEGYGIIKEEVEELEEEFHDLNSKLGTLWYDVKNNLSSQQLFNIEEMYNITLDIIKEAIQVAAMCKRFQKDLGVKNNE